MGPKIVTCDRPQASPQAYLMRLPTLAGRVEVGELHILEDGRKWSSDSSRLAMAFTPGTYGGENTVFPPLVLCLKDIASLLGSDDHLRLACTCVAGYLYGCQSMFL